MNVYTLVVCKLLDLGHAGMGHVELGQRDWDMRNWDRLKLIGSRRLTVKKTMASYVSQLDGVVTCRHARCRR